VQDFNTYLFNILNASAQPSGPMVGLAGFLADRMIYLVVLALIWAWLRSSAEGRERLFATGITMIVALLINWSIATTWYHPRPFEIGVGHQLIAHAADSSFPSDHGTVLFAVAFGLMAARASAVWSGLALLVALGVAWARVYLGIHWPFDMAGSFVVAVVAALAVRAAMRTRPAQRLRNGALMLYDLALDVLHVPPLVSPRAFVRRAPR